MQIILLHEIKPAHVPVDAPPDIYMELENADEIQDITEGLEDLGHTVTLVNTMVDPVVHLLKIAHDKKKYPKNETLVFNYAVGFGTRSREILPAAICELLKLPYTGSDPMTLAHASDKGVAKTRAKSVKVKTPWSKLVHNLRDIREAWSKIHFDILLKPNFEGSSIGVRGPFGPHEKDTVLDIAINLFRDYEQPLLLEQFIAGYEITVPVLGTQNCVAKPLLLQLDGQIHLEHRIYSSSAKSNHQSYSWAVGTQELQSAMDIAAEWAIAIHKKLGCRDFSRSDFRMSHPQDHGSPTKNDVYFLEINPTPQVTGSFRIGQKGEMRDLKEVLAKIIDSAMLRYPDLFPTP